MTIRRQKDVSFKKSKILDELRHYKQNIESEKNYFENAFREGFSILLLDKDVMNGKRLSSHLKGQLGSCRIYVCQSEFTALKVIKRNVIDIIVSEVELQNYNGVDFAQCIRLLMRRDYPVVFYSEQYQSDLKFFINQMDNTQFVDDPFTGTGLSSLLKEVFKKEKLVAA